MTNAFACVVSKLFHYKDRSSKCVRMRVEMRRSARVVFSCPLHRKREFIIFRVSTCPSTKKEVERTQNEQSYFFSRLRSRRRRSRFPGASARFPTPLSRARSPFKARAWRGTGRGWRGSLKVGFLFRGSNLNFHSRASVVTLFFLVRFFSTTKKNPHS